MTPTLLGRLQTRLYLTLLVGVPITGIFAIALRTTHPFLILGWVMLLGFGWDALYNQIQKLFWDHDWPPILQLAAGIWEGIIIFIMLYIIGALGNPPPVTIFMAHYISVWWFSFAASQSMMRLIFPHWRFYGGEWFLMIFDCRFTIDELEQKMAFCFFSTDSQARPILNPLVLFSKIVNQRNINAVYR